MNISWYRKPLEGDDGGRPSARKLRTTISQVKPVNTSAKKGKIMSRGFSAKTRRLFQVRWAPRESWARMPVRATDSWRALRPIPSSASIRCKRRIGHKRLSKALVVGRLLVLQVRLLALVGGGHEPLNFSGAHPTDFRHALELGLGCGEDGSDGAESFEEISRERLPDVGKTFDEEPLPLTEAQRLRFVTEAIFGRGLVLPLPEDVQDESGLFLVCGREDRHPLLDLQGEESPEDGLRVLVRRDLREVAFQEDEGLRVGVLEPLDLLEQPLPHERVEEVRERLSLDPDRPEDVIAGSDLLDLDIDAELAQSIRDVLRFVAVDDERRAHDRANRRRHVNVLVRRRNQPR